jgi:integrase
VSGHGTGTVYFDSARDRWVAQLDNGRTASGGRSRPKRTATTKAGAQRALKQMISEAEQRRLATGSTQTLDAFAKFYFRKEAPTQVRKTTASTYEYLWNHYASPILGHRRVRDLTSTEVVAMMATLQQRNLSISTVKRVRGVLHLLCAAAVRHEIILANPVTRVKPPRATTDRPTQVRPPLTLDESQTLLAAAEGTPLEAFIHLALATGMRRGEILGLKWSDLNLESGEITIARTLIEGSRLLPDGRGVSEPVFNKPKTRNSARTIPLAKPTLDALGRQRGRQSRERLRAGVAWANSDLVFTNALGGALWPSNVYKQFCRLLVDAGLRHVRIHDLRHTAAVLMLINDVPLEQISQALGHGTIEITKDIYANYVPELVGKATLAHAEFLYGRRDDEASRLTGTDAFPNSPRELGAPRHGRSPNWHGDQ